MCFLKALQNIHVGQPRITFPSPFCVAGEGRITYFKICKTKMLKLLEGGNATAVLRGKGAQKKIPNMFTTGSSASAAPALPSSASIGKYLIGPSPLSLSSYPQLKQRDGQPLMN